MYTNIYINKLKLIVSISGYSVLIGYLLEAAALSLIGTTKNKKGDPKNNKGFLEDKGYRPKGITTPKHGEPSGKDREEEQDEKTQYSIGSEKAPRPDEEPSDIETKKRKKMSAAKELLRQDIKDPRLKNAYLLRYCLITMGILILLISGIVSYQNYTDLSTRSYSLEESGYELMIDLREYNELKLEPDYGSPAWDVNKLLTVTSNDIESDLQPGVEFMIEVQDISEFFLKYNRTQDNDLAWSSHEDSGSSGSSGDSSNDKFTIETFMNIFVSSEEVHLARVTVTVWEK